MHVWLLMSWPNVLGACDRQTCLDHNSKSIAALKHWLNTFCVQDIFNRFYQTEKNKLKNG